MMVPSENESSTDEMTEFTVCKESIKNSILLCLFINLHICWILSFVKRGKDRCWKLRFQSLPPLPNVIERICYEFVL